MSLLEVITAMSARLDSAGVSFGHGTSNAFDEAAWLVLWRLGLPLDDLDGQAHRVLSTEELAQVLALVEERISTRQPTAYLTGEAWLQGVPFSIDARAIVPRSLIAEVLAEGSIDAYLAVDSWRGLDLCTGNGSLAVLAAMAWPHMALDACDLSADALAVAKLNVQRHGLADRIELHLGDGLAAVPGRRYDLILCNPPYVNRSAMAALPAEFKAEPALALQGGDDGMDFIRVLMRHVSIHLQKQGLLVLEIGHERAHFEAAFPALQPVWLTTSAGDEQVLLLTRDAIPLTV